ncbi:MAG: hypothetical protein ACKOAG_13550 [Candidatus Kapaibacterium sp.]
MDSKHRWNIPWRRPLSACIVTALAAMVVVMNTLSTVSSAQGRNVTSADESLRVRTLKQAMDLFNDRQYDSALVIFERAYGMDTSKVAVRYEMALTHAAKRSFDSSERITNRVHEFDHQ